MTFDEIHKEVPSGCNCVKNATVAGTDDVFYRRGDKKTANSDNFKSRKELGQPISGKSCKNRCAWQGVSIYLVNGDLERRKIELCAIYQQKQTPDEKWAYFIKLKPGAGMLGQQNEKTNHCELFKCDQFQFEHIEFVEIFDRSIPL